MFSKIDLIADLQNLVRHQSVSKLNNGLKECALLISTIMNNIGIKTELLYLKSTPLMDERHSSIPPLIFGEIKSKSNPNSKTILFYNHYDVQPAGPINLWHNDPFSGIIKDGKIYGRGSADDKGELMTRIKAIEYLLKNTGDVPCNVKFVIEGEEEIGSPHLPKYIQQYKSKFVYDAIVWEFGYVDTQNRPIINLGMKGMLFVEITAKGPSVDLHSSLAPIVENPLWTLVNVLNGLFDQKSNKILIRDWYEDVKSLSIGEKKFFNAQPLFDEQEFKKKYDLGKLLNSGSNLRTSLSVSPTCNLSNISTNNEMKYTKTVIPSSASVKIDFRLVPNMSPQKQLKKLINHLLVCGNGNLKVKYVHGLSPSRTNYQHPFVDIIKKSAESVYNMPSVLNVSSAGSGPMSVLTDFSQIPCIAVGCTSLFSNIHSVNEFASINLLQKGVLLIAEIIKNFSMDKNLWKNRN
jgi:acetylornithine deacetylase/succinyl-diaminopimelate desuccinylase-like protein